MITTMLLLISLASSTDIILTSHKDIEQWWIGFTMRNQDLSCGGTITYVEISDNNHYQQWLPFVSNAWLSWQECHFEREIQPFTAPLSVRITKTYNTNTKVLTAMDVITNIAAGSGGQEFDFGTNFCIPTTTNPTNKSTPRPTRFPTKDTPSPKPTQSPSILPTLPPTHEPSMFPTQNPTDKATMIPSNALTIDPSNMPTQRPLSRRTSVPSRNSVIIAQFPSTTQITETISTFDTQIDKDKDTILGGKWILMVGVIASVVIGTLLCALCVVIRRYRAYIHQLQAANQITCTEEQNQRAIHNLPMSPTCDTHPDLPSPTLTAQRIGERHNMTLTSSDLQPLNDLNSYGSGGNVGEEAGFGCAPIDEEDSSNSSSRIYEKAQIEPEPGQQTKRLSSNSVYPQATAYM
eukprot:32403_1